MSAKQKTSPENNEEKTCIDKLLETVEAKDIPDLKVAIFMHRTPDPDSVGSAVGLRYLLKKNYEI